MKAVYPANLLVNVLKT